MKKAVQGVDVYDPATGRIRSASTDDIACWFIDTGYNAESFFDWLADTPEKALKGIRKVVADVLSDMGINGETIPEPIACKHLR
ncbi:MAG: hypothetical protein V2B20_23530 [Pseudomonadota bacterium]